MNETDALQITLETEIADAIKRFEDGSSKTVIDVRIDRYGGPEFCIGTVLGDPE